jgi:predicted HD phosphohydrolase
MRSAVVSCHIPFKLKDLVQAHAVANGVSMSRWLSDLLALYFKNTSAPCKRKSKDEFTLADLEENEKHVVGSYDTADELIRSLDEDRKNRKFC